MKQWNAFCNKELSKAIIKRSRRRNNFLKNRTDTNRRLYRKQINYCFAFKKNQKRYYGNLNERCVTNDKLFWKIVENTLPLRKDYDYNQNAFNWKLCTCKTWVPKCPSSTLWIKKVQNYSKLTHDGIKEFFKNFSECTFFITLLP